MKKRCLILDTNIISEPLKESPDNNAITWLLQNQESLYLTAITVGELLGGAYRLPAGRRRENLILAIERMIHSYEKRIFVYDGAATKEYARMQTEIRETGRTLSVEDGMIAAICVANNAILATRNTRDFTGLNIPLVNPFEEPTPDVTILDLNAF